MQTKYIITALAITFNVGAQILIKLGSSKDINISSMLNIKILAALILYGLSFLFTTKIYAHFELSTISPIMAGITFILICASSSIVFSEAISLEKISGILLICGGIWLLSQK